MSRRLTFVAAATLGVALALAGCSSSDNANPQNTNQTGASNGSNPSGQVPNQPSGGGSGSAGSGSATPPPPPPEPSNGDPVKWADNFCAPISDYTKFIATKMTVFGESTDQAQMQVKLSQFLDDLANGAGSAVARLKQVEPAPIKDADTVKNQIVDAYTKSEQVLKEASGKMHAGDQDAANQAMASLGEETTKLVDPFKDLANAPLRDAIGKANRCKEIVGG
jgi:hypothetical protein